MLQIPELLAPAGDLERLRYAINYGADAVYCALPEFGMRSAPTNFTPEQLSEGVIYAHARGRKVYLTMNTLPTNEEADRLPEAIKEAAKAGVDAFIVADLGVLDACKTFAPDIDVHLSTQTGITNWAAARAAYKMGAKRVVLAREMTLQDIAILRDKTPPELEIEAFVHGAMCMSVSGRCLLSNYMAGRDANRGQCAQPCRWQYELREKGSKGEYFTIEQDERGSFIMNSRDMRLIEYIPEIVDAGIMSLKIEGRMKSIAYVATVVNAYRLAIDEYKRSIDEGREYKVPASVMRELELASHRPYTTGFAFGDPGAEGQETRSGGYVADGAIAAVVISYDGKTGTAFVAQRNKFYDGEELSILSPGDIGRSFKVSGITNEAGERVQSTPHPKEKLYIGCKQELKPGDILRKLTEKR